MSKEEKAVIVSQSVEDVVKQLSTRVVECNDNHELYVLDTLPENTEKLTFPVGTVLEKKDEKGVSIASYIVRGLARCRKDSKNNSFGEVIPIIVRYEGPDRIIERRSPASCSADEFKKSGYQVVDKTLLPIDSEKKSIKQEKCSVQMEKNCYSPFSNQYHKKPEFADVSFFIGPEKKEFRLHSIIMANFGNFRELFIINNKNQYFPEISADIFELIVEYIYCSTLTICGSQLIPFVQACKKFEMNSVESEIYSRFNIKTTTGFIRTPFDFILPLCELKSISLFIEMETITKLQIEEIPNFDSFKKIIPSFETSPNVLCPIIYQWVKAKPQERKQYLVGLLNAVEWKKISPASRAELICAKLIPKEVQQTILSIV